MPIDDPELDLEEVPEEGDLTFKATVQVRPKAILGEWRGWRSAGPSPRCPRTRSTSSSRPFASARRG